MVYKVYKVYNRLIKPLTGSQGFPMGGYQVAVRTRRAGWMAMRAIEEVRCNMVSTVCHAKGNSDGGA